MVRYYLHTARKETLINEIKSNAQYNKYLENKSRASNRSTSLYALKDRVLGSVFDLRSKNILPLRNSNIGLPMPNPQSLSMV